MFSIWIFTLEPSLVKVFHVNFQVVEKGGEDGREKVKREYMTRAAQFILVDQTIDRKHLLKGK